MNIKEDRQPKVYIDKINDSSPALHKKLTQLAKVHKLVLCLEYKENMNNVGEQMIK